MINKGEKIIMAKNVLVKRETRYSGLLQSLVNFCVTIRDSKVLRLRWSKDPRDSLASRRKHFKDEDERDLLHLYARSKMVIFLQNLSFISDPDSSWVLRNLKIKVFKFDKIYNFKKLRILNVKDVIWPDNWKICGSKQFEGISVDFDYNFLRDLQRFTRAV